MSSGRLSVETAPHTAGEIFLGRRSLFVADTIREQGSHFTLNPAEFYAACACGLKISYSRARQLIRANALNPPPGAGAGSEIFSEIELEKNGRMNLVALWRTRGVRLSETVLVGRRIKDPIVEALMPMRGYTMSADIARAIVAHIRMAPADGIEVVTIGEPMELIVQFVRAGYDVRCYVADDTIRAVTAAYLETKDRVAKLLSLGASISATLRRIETAEPGRE
jgi:hypothetical protein